MVAMEAVTVTAGQTFSKDCNFSSPADLVRSPTVHWLDSTLSKVSDNGTLSFPHLLTSHGGEYVCVVNISIPQLSISLTGRGTTTLIVQSKLKNLLQFCVFCTLMLECLHHSVPAPSVVITETATPFNGTEFSLSCTVTVDQSVDIPVNIFTHWLLPHYTDTPSTISSNMSERISELQQLHNLTFRPLCSQDSGSYTCNATIISRESDHFIKDNTALKATYLSVQGKLVFLENVYELIYESVCVILVTMCLYHAHRAASTRSIDHCELHCWSGQK